ncbi:hypothetical protein [Ilumatobacter sp.]|uniref:hypothetical protein n=1 Tax=Ilumatobacter sp. TaxID=1967498 RepID=UPI003751D361
MNHHLRTIVEDQHNQLQHQPRPIRTKDQPAPWRIIVTDLALDQQLIDRMKNVLVRDAVLLR